MGIGENFDPIYYILVSGNTEIYLEITVARLSPAFQVQKRDFLVDA